MAKHAIDMFYSTSNNICRLRKDILEKETSLDYISFDVLDRLFMYIFYVTTEVPNILYTPKEDPIYELVDIISKIEQNE